MKNIRVYILGHDHYNTYGIIRSLGEKGIKSNVVIIGTSMKDSFVLRSKYIYKKGAFPTKEESISFLISEASVCETNILICCSDDAEELVMTYSDLLKKLFILPVCDSIDDQKSYMSKSFITKLAEEIGFSVPMTWKVENRKIPDSVMFPCITKPEISTLGRKSDIVKCLNRVELENIVYDKNRCSNFTIQQYISFEKEISILGVVLNDGTVVFSGCIDKIRTCMIGTSSFACMVDNSIIGDYKKKLEKLLSLTAYKGLFSAEFLLKDKVLYFLEINFRNDGNTYVSTKSGINLPYLYVQSYLSQKKIDIPTPKLPCYFMLEIEDFMSNVILGKVSLTEWRHNFLQSDCCLVYNKFDKKPFLKKLYTFIVSIIKRKLKR